MYVCMYVCMYVYIYIYIYIRTHGIRGILYAAHPSKQRLVLVILPPPSGEEVQRGVPPEGPVSLIGKLIIHVGSFIMIPPTIISVSKQHSSIDILTEG